MQSARRMLYSLFLVFGNSLKNKQSFYLKCSPGHCALHFSCLSSSAQRLLPVCHSVHSKQSIKIEAPPYIPVRAMQVCVLWSCRVACLCVTYQLSVAECVFCDAVAEVLPLLYLNQRSLPLACTAALLTMSRPSTDSIWSDLRKRTGTITLFSFFRWVPSERRKEGRGEEVNKPSAFLQKNKETLDRHLHFSMKYGFSRLLEEREEARVDVS